MKKILIFIIAVLAALSAAFAVGCKKNNSLETPANIYVDSDDFLRWDKVKNADSYLVIIDGEEYITENNEIDLFDICTQFKEYSVKIRAVGNDSSSETAYFNFELSTHKALGYKLTQDQKGFEFMALDKERLPSKVIIPDEIGGKPVVGLAGSAFSGCENLKAIRLPDSMAYIKGDAFYNCKNLERINIPSGLKQIENSVFYGCEKLKNINLPVGLEKILNAAFANCKNLEKVDLPVSLTSLYLGAFKNCVKLESLKIPRFVNSLYGRGIDTLVSVDEKNPYYFSLNNCVIKKADNSVVAGGCYSNIPEVAESIGKNAFSGSCITSIRIPGNIKTIAQGAFGYAKLEDVVIEDGVEEICQSAFTTCSYLKKITIPASVTKIENGSIIYGCDALEEFVVSPGNKTYYAVDGYILTKTNNTIVTGTLKKPIPAVAEEFAEYAFYGNKQVKNVFVPANIKKVGDYAFTECPNIKTAVFHSETIGSYIFGKDEKLGCLKITSIRLSKNVKQLSARAFYTCHNANSMTISENTVIGDELTDSYTVYYPENADLSAVTIYRTNMIQSGLGYDGDFPYVKYVKPIYLTLPSLSGGEATRVIEYEDILCVPIREGYTFEGWSKNEDCTTIDYTVKYYPERREYTIGGFYHDCTETYYTESPFSKKVGVEKNEYYDPEVKILYAVWRKN